MFATREGEKLTTLGRGEVETFIGTKGHVTDWHTDFQVRILLGILVLNWHNERLTYGRMMSHRRKILQFSYQVGRSGL